MHGTFIIKTTRACNLKCRYCRDRSDSPSDLDFRTLALFMREVFSIEALAGVTFVFHGGEPLLREREYLEKALFLERQCNHKGLPIKNTIQTNGTLLNRQWSDFFRDNGFNVGVSLDGPPEIHNRLRPLPTGDSYQQTRRGIECLKESGTNFGILTVVSEPLLAWGASGFFSFIREQELRNISILFRQHPLTQDHSHSVYLREYGDFVIKLSRLLLNEESGNYTIREINSKMNSLLGRTPDVCTEGGVCSGRYFGLDIHGSVGVCDTFLGTNRFVMGSYRDSEYLDFFNNDKMESYRREESRLRSLCQECKWYAICRGGCLYDRIMLGPIEPEECPHARLYQELSQRLGMAIEAGLSAARR